MINPQLLDYIKQQRAQNVSEEAIKNNLVAGGGWSQSDINEAFSSLEVIETVKVIQPHKNRPGFKIFIFSFFTLILVGGGYFAYSKFFLKNALADALSSIVSAGTYHQDFTAETTKDNQKVIVTGSFDVDTSLDKIKGTIETLFPLGTPTQNVKLISDNVVIGSNAYVKLSTDNILLQNLLKLPDSWISFDLNSLPPEYSGFNTGYLASHLSDFLKAGKSVLIIRQQSKETLNNEETIHFTLNLSPNFSGLIQDNSAKSFFNSVSSSGNIELWIGVTDNILKKIVISTDDTVITSLISSIGVPVAIEIPQNPISYDEFKHQAFEASLSQTPVKEVILGAYGGVSDHLLQVMSDSIKQNFKVKVTIGANYKEGLPQVAILYNANRKQYDADALWTYLLSLTKSSGPSVRYIYVLENDIYTSLQPERPYIFSRSLQDVNTAIISIARIQYQSDTSSVVASSDTIDMRIRKLVLRTLGVTVGLANSPSSNDINCVMYQADNLSDLDKKGEKFCGFENDAISKVFVASSTQ